jgi:hypothetical protein
MALTSRFFSMMTYPAARRAAPAIALLAILGSLMGDSRAQVPAPPPPPREAPPPKEASAPKDAPAPKAAPAKEASASAGDSTPGVAMIQDLLAALGKYDQDGRPEKQKLGFDIPEAALNEYLAYTLRTRPRPGITALKVVLLPNNQVTSDLEIDFDAVQKWNPDIFPEVLRPLLTGKRTIHTDVKFEVKNGTLSFSLKDAQGPDGKAIVNKVMSAVLQALGSRQPESYDTAKPIPLPFGLKKIWTEKQMICGET